ncbi:unconventional prefoldin RPB5 interactor-like protein isoform X2 [Halichondria panicea]|uniref:unconventional prefoldin RPB5 interactor-like protein isoform X2 n=1 Tax=Halichondria panicea TaxID=6063 RepID=UPI00312B9178
MQEAIDFSRLQQEHSKATEESNDKIQKWQEFKADYEALQTRLSTLPNQLTHDVMVPFGRFAFARGQLYHSNEVTVLLGDNWFIKTTTKHALEIVERRKKYVCEMLSQEQECLNDLEKRQLFTEEFQSAVGDTVEIKEKCVPPQSSPGKGKERKAWVPKGNVPPPRRVFPPLRKGPRDTLEAVSSTMEKLNVNVQSVSESVTTATNQPLRITVTHGEASNDNTSEGSSEGGRPLYSSPGDIFPRLTRHDVVDSVGMAAKSVRWGPTEYSTPPVTQATPPPPGRPRAVRPFTGQVIERISPQTTPTTDKTTPIADKGNKRSSRFKSNRTKTD